MSLFGPPNVEKLKAKQDVPGLVKALHHPAWLIRARAATALRGLGDGDATEALASVLHDDSAEVRREAALGLAAKGDPRAAGALIEVLEKDPSDEARYKAAEVLGELGDAMAVEALGRAAMQQASTGLSVRHAAQEALGKIGGPEAERILQEAKEREEEEAARAAKQREEAARAAEEREKKHKKLLGVWKPAPSGLCDVCNTGIEPSTGLRVPNAEFKGYAKNGYNPFARGRVRIAAALAIPGETDMDRYRSWMLMVATDSTDWGLCRPCATDVAEFAAQQGG